ncbi:hypothetical protein DL89DRAFT_264101 [Linderina pennispora]|uniref:Dienelactone hydrolase domain-containing protein n=1 Tax=Linderina pennispora TaxID=61395 RepID=A0A1Y1WLU2_9FUNG|nr:uncharacterized protein DL89DRAFT_264101 [Linderina pennispora]ORX74146.1 hypothetical protein DL89DRAFT_264101 [Linderina pennispora]
MSSFVNACCNTPPVTADYTPTGTAIQIGGTKIYLAGSTRSRFGIIFCYDIFGFHPNVYQYADLLGQAGFRIAMPDFLHDRPLTVSDLGNKDVFADFLMTRAGWAVNRDVFVKTRKVLADEGIKQIGAIGFCWGAKLVMGAIGENLGISAGCLVHPSALARTRRTFLEEFAQVKQRFEMSVRDRYEDMHHGPAQADRTVSFLAQVAGQ